MLSDSSGLGRAFYDNASVSLAFLLLNFDMRARYFTNCIDVAPAASNNPTNSISWNNYFLVLPENLGVLSRSWILDLAWLVVDAGAYVDITFSLVLVVIRFVVVGAAAAAIVVVGIVVVMALLLN